MLKINIALITLSAATIVGAAPQKFFVAPSGSDVNSGTKSRPFKTITRARDAVRLVNKAMTEDINVYLRGGNYPVTSTIEFDQTDSGMNGHRIYYQAYKNEKPILNGAVQVKGWSKHEGNIYKAALNSSTKLRSLIVDDKRAYMARQKMPTQGGWGTYKITAGQADWARKSGSKPDGVKYDKAACPLLENAGDVEITRNSTWNSSVVCVREIDTEGAHRILKLQQPYGAIALNQGWGAGFSTKGNHTIHNAFEFLDSPGEFYFNKHTKTLFYYSDGEDMSKAVVYAPRSECLISIKGSSRADRVRNITFKGITFANTEAKLPQVGGSHGKTTVQAATFCYAFEDSNWHRTKYQAYDAMPSAITVSSAESIRFKDNTLSHIGNEGIGFVNDVIDSEFIGNLCFDIGGSAILVGHPQHVYEGDGGKNEKLSPAEEGICKNIILKNNVLYDLTKLYYGHAAITAFFVESLKIEKNHLQGTQYSAVSLGWGWNNFDEVSKRGNPTTTCKNNIFNNNRVYDCMQMLHDGGAFYTLGSQPNSEASGNYVKADTKHFQGVYHPDEGTAWYTGKDLVFEITPGQDNFELNTWKRKHDNHYDNVYSTSKAGQYGAPRCTLSNLHVYPDAKWPPEALAIIRAAGPEPQYHHLLEDIPYITFEPSKRYDIKPPKAVRYEAEEADLAGGSKVNTDHRHYSGTGFVDGYHNNGSASTTFTVTAPTAGSYSLSVVYSAGFGTCSDLGLYLNDEQVKTLSCKKTANWDTWETHSETVTLQAGVNTIALNAERASKAPMNIDCIKLLED